MTNAKDFYPIKQLAFTKPAVIEMVVRILSDGNYVKKGCLIELANRIAKGLGFKDEYQGS